MTMIRVQLGNSSATTNTPLTIAAETVAMVPDITPGELAAFSGQRTTELKVRIPVIVIGHSSRR
jgi:hypothetical protein